MAKRVLLRTPSPRGGAGVAGGGGRCDGGGGGGGVMGRSARLREPKIEPAKIGIWSVRGVIRSCIPSSITLQTNRYTDRFHARHLFGRDFWQSSLLGVIVTTGHLKDEPSLKLAWSLRPFLPQPSPLI